jgi:Alg9-like mannosyltransferase family
MSDTQTPAAHRHTQTWLCLQILLCAGCALGTGWPFVSLVMLPFAADCLVTAATLEGGAPAVLRRVLWGAVCLAAVGGATFAVDASYYGRDTWPSLNIFR